MLFLKTMDVGLLKHWSWMNLCSCTLFQEWKSEKQDLLTVYRTWFMGINLHRSTNWTCSDKADLSKQTGSLLSSLLTSLLTSLLSCRISFRPILRAVFNKVHRQTDGDPTFPLLGLLSEPKIENIYPIYLIHKTLYLTELDTVVP